jgi:tRNA (guanine-N7-)-methyltransferase
MRSFPHVFQYPFSVLQEQKFGMKGRWNELFFKNSSPIVLELGCGKGEYTVGLAELHPDKNYIGVDIKGARIWSGAKQVADKRLTNVAFLRTHIELLTAFFAPGEVSEIWLTFPDPQMKKLNRRMTSTRFMKLYGEVLGPPALIHLKTDSDYLFAYTREMIKVNHLPVEIENNDLDHNAMPDASLSISTFYEQQWRERGLNIKYIRFICEPRETLVEPQITIEPDAYRSYNRSQSRFTGTR